MRSRPLLILSTLICLAFASAAPAALAQGVQPQFDLSDPEGGPFPADVFTVPDPTQLTGLRINLPSPDCSVRPSDCNDINVLNQLDGFNLQPRISIPFTGPINPATVSSDTVFLYKLGCLVASCPGDNRIGINQVVWDPDTNTLYAESDEVLDQDARYVLVVTNGVRVPSGDRIDSDQFHDVLHSGTAYTDRLLSAVDGLKAVGIPPGSVAAASMFTTESATAVMEKIRDQLAQATPAPADFTLGPRRERTVFPLADVASISWKRQDTGPPLPVSFGTPRVPLDSLRVVPGIGTVAFGRYSSPDYQNSDGVIPAVGTKRVPKAQPQATDVYFNLFLPAGPEPAAGWPVVIAGHGAGGGGKNNANAPWSVAATLAEHGMATIAINAVGYGGGPLGTLTVTNTDGTAVTLLGGGRGVDRNGNGRFDQPAGSLPEGVMTRFDCTDPSECQNAIVLTRDGFRQTAVDLMQLVREIQVGIEVDGDSAPDLDPNRIYYLGSSFGGMYGTLTAALEPSLRAKVLSGVGGPVFEIGRLNSVGPFRSIPGQVLADRTPSLTNLPVGCDTDPINPEGNCTFPFNENIPPRNHAPIANTVAGAIAIQNEIGRIEWAMESGDPTVYAPHLRQAPLPGVPATPVLIAFAQGDVIVPNSTTGNLLRAGDLADRTLYFHALDAYVSIGVTDPDVAAVHEWLVALTLGAARNWALLGQESVATFFASDGHTTADPDGPCDPSTRAGCLFDTPFEGALP
jgi:hypothetical protein